MKKKEEFEFKAYVETSARKSNEAKQDDFTKAADADDAISKVFSAHEAFSQVIEMIEKDQQERQQR